MKSDEGGFDLDRHVGGRLEARRVEKDLSHAQLAEQAGITSRQLADIEAGAFRPDQALLVRLGDILDVNPSYFFPDDPGSLYN